MSKQTLIDAVKDSPIPGVASLVLLGVPLEHWVLILTALWALWRVGDAVLTTYWKFKDRKAFEAKLNDKTMAEALEERDAGNR